MTRINLGGIRYLPLAPAEALRRAVREYQDVRPATVCNTLAYLTTRPSVVLCREDWVKVLSAASGAQSDIRLSAESRSTFARICSVLKEAVPARPEAAALRS